MPHITFIVDPDARSSRKVRRTPARSVVRFVPSGLRIRRMGLSIEIAQLAYLKHHDEEGATWFRESVTELNEVLLGQGHPAHVEPEDIEPELLPHMSSFGYSWLHYLRR